MDRDRSALLAGVAIVTTVALVLSAFALGVALSARATVVGSAPPAAAAGGASEAPAAQVEVSLTEFAITPADIVVAEGGTLVVRNDGSIPHNLTVVDTDIATADLDPGSTETLDLSGLAPGTYRVVCTIPGHEQAGMVATLTIGSTAGGGTPAPTAGSLTPEEMDANYRASLEAFPAATETHGGQVLEPTVLPDGTKEFHLVVDEVRWEVEPGKFVDAMAYNGQIPGPTMFVDVGDRVRVVVENRLDDQATVWHPHGLRGHPNAVDGVGYVTQDPIPPGGTFTYEFVADTPSVVGYHSHHNSLHQVPDGLMGLMVIGDYRSLVPGGVPVVAEVPMVLNDSGVIGLSLNGKSFPATQPYQLAPGQALLVHYLNEGQMAHPMHIHGLRTVLLAKDGVPLPQPQELDTLNVAPGERYTVAVIAEPDQTGTWLWHCHILSHVKRPDGSLFGMATAIVVQ